MTQISATPWRWLRRLLFLLTGTVTAAALLLAGALLILDDADYKRILVWASAAFLDSDLEIAGPFSVSLSDGIHVSAGDVRLQAHDGSYFVTTQQFSTRFRVVSIMSGSLVIHDLVLTDTHLRINEAQAARTAGFSLPPVVIARAHFKNLAFEYQEASPGTLHSFSLDELVIGGVNDAGPLGIQASGIFNGRKFDLNGSLPSLADMLERDRPHPVEVRFNSEYIKASLDGHVADFVKGRGMDLGLKVHVQDVQEVLEIFGDGIPRVGDVDGTARLYGDYDSPGLDNIDFSLHRDDEVAIRVTGAVDDIVSGKGLDLGISGHSSQPRVASWLLFGKLDRISSISLDARLQANFGRIQVHNVKASASTSDGLELAASGNAELYDAGHVFARNDKGIKVTFSAPTTAAINLLHYEGVPELGPVDGNVRLLASRDAIGLYDVNVKIGDRRGQQSGLQGSIARIGLQDGAMVTGIDLRVTLQVPDVAALAKQAGYDLPPLGRGKAELRASGSLNQLRLSQVNVRIGDSKALLVTAQGLAQGLDLTRQALPETADFSVTATEPGTAEISRILTVTLPALGRTHATGQVQLRGETLQFQQVKVDIGAADQPAIRVEGKATTTLHKGSNIDIRFDVAATDLLMAFTDLKPGYLGRLQGMLDVSSVNGSWGIEQFRVTSSQTRLYELDIGGENEDFNKTNLVSVKSLISVRDPEALGNALNIDLSGISPWTSKGVLSSRAGTLSYHASGTLGSTTSTTVINGYLKNGKPHFTGKMNIPVLHMRDFGFEKDRGGAAAKPSVSDTDRTYVFSRKPLNVSFLNKFNLEFELLVDRVESRGQLSINKVNGTVTVSGGRLNISPLKLSFAGGQMDVQFELYAGSTPTYRLQASGDDIVLGPLMSQVQKDVPITGYQNIDLDLTARGRSPHDLASSLSGNLSIGLENVKIPAKYLDYLSVDVFGWVFSATRRKETYANLNCVVVAFDVINGEMKSRLLIADGPSLTVAGHINLDLGAETMDILLIPKQKERIFASVEPVKIRGAMLDPKVEAVPVKAALSEVGAIALLPTVVIPVRVLGKLWSILDDGDQVGEGCASLKSVTESAEKELQK